MDVDYLRRRRRRLDVGDPTLTLHQLFAGASTLAAAALKGPTVGLTRATTAWDFDSDGNRAAFTSGNPRFGYTPQTGAVSFGLATFQAVENFMLHNGDWTNAVYDTVTDITAVKDAVGLDGNANSASTLTATGANGVIRQSITLTSAPRNYSIWVRRKTGTGAIEITDDGGANYTAITGSINSTTYTPVDITRTQANPDVGFRIVTSGDEIEVDDGHVTTASWRYPLPIPTGASSVTVDADVAIITDMSWHGGTGRTFFINTSMPVNSGISSARVFDISDGTNQEFERLQMLQGSHRFQASTVTAGGNTGAVTFDDTIVTGSAVNKVAFSYVVDSMIGSHNGTSDPSEDTNVDQPNTPSQMLIGSPSGGAGFGNLHIAEIKYFNVKKSAAFNDSLTVV